MDQFRIFQAVVTQKGEVSLELEMRPMSVSYHFLSMKTKNVG